MEYLKILALHPTTPDVTSVSTLFFDNFLPVLRNKIPPKIVWLVYRPEKTNLANFTNDDTSAIDIHDYDNALDILQKIKPDIIFANASPNLIDYAFSLGGKSLNIPVISGFFSRTPGIQRKKLLFSYVSRFFEKSVPTDHEKSKKPFRRGLFFIYKYLFLIKTQKIIGFSNFQILKNFFFLIKEYASWTDFTPNPKFTNTIHWVDGYWYYDSALKQGFDKDSLVLTGNPMFDSIYQKIQNYKKDFDTKKINVLFLTSALYEHGFWSKHQRDELIKNICQEFIKYKDEMSLTFKIHPSAEILSQYEEIVNSIDPSIKIFQKEDIFDFLKNADVVLGFQSNSALESALLFDKPIIICDFYSLMSEPFIKEDVAYVCKKSDEIISLVRTASKSNSKKQTQRENYIKKHFYKFDGNASQRLTDVILKLTK